MDDAFRKLSREGQNSVENLIKLLKDAKIIERAKAAEEKAMVLFADVKDRSHVTLEEFRRAVQKAAKEKADAQKEAISETGSSLLEAASAAKKSFLDSWFKK